MKRVLFVFALLLAAVPCFAEIRVDQAGNTDEVGNSVNFTFYWNDKYNYPKMSAKEYVRLFRAEQQRQVYKARDFRTVRHYYVIPEGTHVVIFAYSSTLFLVGVMFFHYGEDYSHNLYNGKELYRNSFDSYNSAKAQFDSLCQKYYNEIPR